MTPRLSLPAWQRYCRVEPTPMSTPGETKIGGGELTRAHSVGIAAILICCLLISAIWATATSQSLGQIGGTTPSGLGDQRLLEANAKRRQMNLLKLQQT